MLQGLQSITPVVMAKHMHTKMHRICLTGAVETQLQQTAKLQHTDPAIQQLARSTRTVTSRLRFGLGLVNAMGRAAVAKQLLQQRPAS